MNTVLSSIIGIQFLVYLDDVIGKNLIDYNDKLRNLLQSTIKTQ